MNYYEHHIGDYQRKTAHLSLAEHGAYLLMLHAFYATERPLPKDRKVLYRLLRATRSSERNAIDSVANQFWYETADGISNRRGEEVLEKYRKWLTQQKANGSFGGRPRKTHGLEKENPSGTQAGFENETQPKPMGGYRARVPLPTPHLDEDLHTHSETTSQARPTGNARVGVRSKSGWTPPKTWEERELEEREEAAREGPRESAQKAGVDQRPGIRHAGR